MRSFDPSQPINITDKTMNTGYMKMIQKEPVRVWEVRDKNGKLLHRGDCIDCTLTAYRYDMKVESVH